MRWQFWKSNNSGELPQRMSRHLSWRFGISEETMKTFQYASMPGTMKKKTLIVRVFDPALLTDDAPIIRKYSDLDHQQSAVQFECQWYPASSKFVDVVDLRPSASA